MRETPRQTQRQRLRSRPTATSVRGRCAPAPRRRPRRYRDLQLPPAERYDVTSCPGTRLWFSGRRSSLGAWTFLPGFLRGRDRLARWHYPTEPEPRGDEHQLSHRSCLHPPHDSGAMELDGLLDHAKIPGDLLVEPARRQRSQHFALARRETGKPLPKFFDIGPPLPCRRVLLDRGAYRRNQGLRLHGLG